MRSPSPSAEALGERLLGIGLALTAVAVGLQTAAHLANAFLFDGTVWNLDADAEGNAFTWASSAATFAAGLAAILWAAAFRPRRRAFLILAVILVFFSLDDIVQFHEHAGLEFGEDILGLPDYLAVRLWTIFYLPLLLLSGALLFDLPRVLWPRATRFVWGGLALLVGAFGVEVVGALTRWVEERGTSWPEDIRSGIEEGLELGGWMLIASGLLAGVCTALASLPAVEARPAGH
jgi:hypothetical protein